MVNAKMRGVQCFRNIQTRSQLRLVLLQNTLRFNPAKTYLSSRIKQTSLLIFGTPWSLICDCNASFAARTYNSKMAYSRLLWPNNSILCNSLSYMALWWWRDKVWGHPRRITQLRWRKQTRLREASVLSWSSGKKWPTLLLDRYLLHQEDRQRWVSAIPELDVLLVPEGCDMLRVPVWHISWRYYWYTWCVQVGESNFKE